MSALPPINGLLHIVLEGGTMYRSRVEDREDRLVTVGAPLGAGMAELPRVDEVIELGWIANRTRYLLPVKLLEMIREEPSHPAQWKTEIVGSARTNSRREFVRGGGGEIVELLDAGPEPLPRTIKGFAVDLSEGGCCVRLPGVEIDRGEKATVRIWLDGKPIELTGVVLDSRQTGDATNTDVDTVLLYTLSNQTAQVIRKYLFQWELALRRVS